MADALYRPTQVIPHELSEALAKLPTWFVIGGHAVRCFCPYRPSRDVDFGVRSAADLDGLIEELRRSSDGNLEITEKTANTVHLRWRDIRVSVFLLDQFADFVEEQRLTISGILATKLHAILDRGTRRDFFDLYVTLQHQRLGLAECLEAMQRVYRQPVNQQLLLRALTYFDDAEREAALPGEGRRDWAIVKGFFEKRVGDLLVPPGRPLQIQSNLVDVYPSNSVD